MEAPRFIRPDETHYEHKRYIGYGGYGEVHEVFAYTSVTKNTTGL